MKGFDEPNVSLLSPAQVTGKNDSSTLLVTGIVRDEAAKFPELREPGMVDTNYYETSDYIYDMMDIVTRMPPDRRRMSMAILQCIDIMESRRNPELDCCLDPACTAG